MRVIEQMRERQSQRKALSAAAQSGASFQPDLTMSGQMQIANSESMASIAAHGARSGAMMDMADRAMDTSGLRTQTEGGVSPRRKPRPMAMPSKERAASDRLLGV